MFSSVNRSHLIKRLRSSRALWNIGTSYFAFFSSAAWALVSIPVAVRYLDRDSIGLWTVVNAFLSYLVWMDFGISHATGRLMAPAVAANNQKEINRWWTATSSALWTLALLVLLLGLAFSPLAISLLGIQPALRGDALWLFAAGVGATAFSLPLRCVPGFLAAQERFHWVPLVQSVVPWINLLVFYLLLRAGWGVKSYVVAIAVTQVFNWMAYGMLVRCGPQRPHFDRSGITRSRFKQLFSFSGSLMVLSTIDSFIATLPALILARMGGLGLVPTYNFSTKGALLGSSLVSRTYQAFQPAWQRAYVSGNLQHFRAKFEAAGYITLGMATCGAAAVIAINPVLVAWLAGSDYYIGGKANLWIAVSVLTLPMGSYFQSLLTLSGSFGRSSLFFIFKLGLAIGFGLVGWRMSGLVGIAAIFSLLPLFNGIYGFLIGSRKCGFSLKKAPSKGVAGGMFLAIIVIITTGAIANENSPVPHDGLTRLNLRAAAAALPTALLGLLMLAWGFLLNFRQGFRSA